LRFWWGFHFFDLQSFWQKFAMSKSITSEEREMELKHDVQIFNEQVVQK
jgi:hypothetical protein